MTRTGGIRYKDMAINLTANYNGAVFSTILLAALLAPQAPYPGVQGRYLAIGVDAYREPIIPRLNAPESDAAKIASALSAKGLLGERLAGKDATRAAILARIAAAKATLKLTDAFVLYLSGQGTYSPAPAFLPYDFDPKRASATSIDGPALTAALATLPCARVVVIADASYGEGLARPSKRIAYVCACRKNEQALETTWEDGPGGLFTHFFIPALDRDHDWPAALDHVAASIKDLLRSKGSFRRQTPVIVGTPDPRLLGTPDRTPVPLSPPRGERGGDAKRREESAGVASQVERG